MGLEPQPFAPSITIIRLTSLTTNNHTTDTPLLLPSILNPYSCPHRCLGNFPTAPGS
ncbi:hypothetical protein F9C07_6725 [Aspergillus flavus]|uniref:Uncharacterized protein n=1 Tax=Aspergillus flavus (strain ATCC 200026 / FGSC A1120 / IAM 13836 / NRRL 3357 / JCM 12722 / SRRC 167) TaxID=332952 RepID=A0A7U2QTB3_ASPFN|nr:hypothetical protein AFLA_005169 [Aspergillus flavus NRRL3357]QRD83669.1 hypothetical protein F9C07_6725 [Aspergillus flavus]